MKMYLLMLIATALNFCSGQTTSAETRATQSVSHCNDYGNITVTSHIGWPFKLNCRSIASKMWEWKALEFNATCSLRRSKGKEIFRIRTMFVDIMRRTVQYPLIALNGENEFFVELNISGVGSCGRMKILVEETFSNSQNYSCSTLPESYDVRNVNPFRGSLNIACTVYPYNEVGLHADPSELTYEWWYNCNKTLPQKAKKDPVKRNELNIIDATFKSGEEYVCAVKYNNQVRFVARYILCLTDPAAPRFSFIKCPKQVQAKPGFNVSVTCYFDHLGRGLPLSPQSVTWYKGSRRRLNRSSSLCYTRLDMFSFETLKMQSNSKTSCKNFRSRSTLEGKCFQYKPRPNEVIDEDRRYNFDFVIKDFQPSDAGEYTVHFLFSRFDHFRTVTVIPDGE